MSLETAIAELTAAVSTNNDLIRQMLANDAAAGGASAGEADKPKKTTAKKETVKKEDAGTDKGGDDEGGDLAKDLAALKDKLSTWLGEFAKEEDKKNPDGTHPEVLARKEALKKAFGQLEVKALGDIKTAEQVKKLTNWFEKAKNVDKGHGAGRFAADPVEAKGDDDDIEL